MTHRVAVVTGASAAIGRAIASALARDGFDLALVGRRMPEMLATSAAAGARRTEVFQADLLVQSEIDGLCGRVQAKLGQPTVLVNVAGVWHDETGKLQGPPLHETPIQQVERVVGVGLMGSVRMAREFIPAMIEAGNGRIVQIGCGFAGPHEARGWLHYYVTNKAIEAFTAGLASEMRPYNIQVNCIAPWYVATEAVARFYPNDQATALSPERIGEMASFLASERAHDISGQTIELRSHLDKT